MLSLRIALRYLLARKSHGAVNVISAISLAAIAVASAAMIIVLSVFNGFSQLAESKLSAMDPDFMVTPVRGKAIENVDSLLNVVRAVEGVGTAQPEITEQAFAVAGERQMPVTLKGITPAGLEASGLRHIIIDGTIDFSADTCALSSVGTAMGLGVRPSAGIDMLTIYEPRRVGRINPANPLAGFNTTPLKVTAVYQVEQEEYDRDMVVVPYATAAMLLSYDNMATSIAVSLTRGASVNEVGERLKDVCGDKFTVKNRREQQEQAFRMIEVEKWITFLMLAFILLIASCNIISTLSMLILEKEDNMAIITAMGGTRRFINRIFTTQGWLIVIIGGLAGLAAGCALVLGQQHFGWIKLAGTDPALLSVESYPVALELPDLLLTFATILVIALIITPVIPLIRRK